MNWNRKAEQMWVQEPVTGKIFPLPVGDAGESERYWSVKTHYPSFDELFKGFKSGNLVGIGGKHAVGKSALALNLAFSMADHGTKVCLFSFELSEEDVIARLLARMTTTEVSAIQSRNLTQDQAEAVEETLGIFDSLPLEIYAPPTMTVDAIRETARKSLRGCTEGILIIDCLQLIQPSRKCDCYDDIDERLDSIVISLKRLAMELQVPVIVTTHLDQTDDLGDAYPLSEHADIVMFLDRAQEDEGSDELGIPMDIYIAKFRQGPMGATLRLTFAPQWMWFVQYVDSQPTISDETVPTRDLSL